MKIVVYTLPYELTNEANKINQLFESGLEELHIRKPSFSADRMFSLVSEIDNKHHSKIVLHQHHKLINQFKLKGLHFPQDFFTGFIGFYRSLKYGDKKEFQLSTSVTAVNKVENVSSIFDLVFVGPMYKKFSEENSKSNFDAFEVKSAISNSTKEIYAFGGIDFKNQQKIHSLGFKGMVLQASVWKSGDVVNAYKAFALSQEKMNDSDQFVKIA